MARLNRILMLLYIILGGEARIMSTQAHCIVKLLYTGMLKFGNLRACDRAS